MPTTVLLLASEAAAGPVADALRRELDAVVELQPSLRAGLASLRRRDFSLVLLDEALAAAEPATEPDMQTSAVDRLYQAGGAPLLELNLAISSAPRIVRQVRAALARRNRDLALARTAAASLLHSELNQTLSGLLLESELALRDASPAQAPKLRELVQLAVHLRDRLRPAQDLHG
jgi:hypothetical protein